VGNKFIWGNISDYTIAHFHYLGNKNATVKGASLVYPLVLLINNGNYPLGAFL